MPDNRFDEISEKFRADMDSPEGRRGTLKMLLLVKKCYFLTDEVLKGVAVMHVINGVLSAGPLALAMIERDPSALFEGVKISFEAHKKVRDEEWPNG